MALDPNDAELLRQAIEDRLLDVRTAATGKVVTYDAAKRTASIRPVTKRALSDVAGGLSHEELPVLPDVPVIWPGGGGFTFEFNLAAGDHVLLVFTDDSDAIWQETGEVSIPGNLQRHSLSNAKAIPLAGGVKNRLSDKPSSGQGVLLVPGGGFLRISTNGGTAQFLARADKVNARLDALESKMNDHTHPTGVGPSGPAIVPLAPGASTACSTAKAE